MIASLFRAELLLRVEHLFGGIFGGLSMHRSLDASGDELATLTSMVDGCSW